jgi:hypothetical protein
MAADLPVICVGMRHKKALLTAQQLNKTDRNDARGIAQMMRVGPFRPVHVKTLFPIRRKRSPPHRLLSGCRRSNYIGQGSYNADMSSPRDRNSSSS